MLGHDVRLMPAHYVKLHVKQIALWHKKEGTCQRLSTTPGVGPMTATAIIASIGDGHLFSSGRAFAAWLRLTPREYSIVNHPKKPP